LFLIGICFFDAESKDEMIGEPARIVATGMAPAIPSIAGGLLVHLRKMSGTNPISQSEN
jgi:hypothetical protein